MADRLGICSHKRSGTHLLAATLLLNFELPDQAVTAIVRAGQRFVAGDGRVWGPGERAEVPWGGLWLSHGFYRAAREPHLVLYIVRHPVDTLMSYWRFMDPAMRRDPAVYVGRERAAFWLRHARGYTRNCCWVRYEDLTGPRHDAVLERVAERFGLRSSGAAYRRIEERIGWYPAERPEQPSEPPLELLESIRAVVPRGFLGYEV